jgi:hypothetical protein
VSVQYRERQGDDTMTSITIDLLQDMIWNIGGILFSIFVFTLILVLLFSFIMDRISWFYKKEVRESVFFWCQNKEKIMEIIKKEREKEKKDTQ